MSEVRFPAPEEAIVRYILERHARDFGEATYVRFEDGASWTFAETLAQARGAASGLSTLGVRKGDHVFCWLPNGQAALRAWLGINYLGAVFVPANLGYRGSLLEHVLNLSDAKVGIVHHDLLPRLRAVGRGLLEDVIVVAGEGAPIGGLTLHSETLLEDCGDPGPLAQPLEPWDPMVIIFTSGTTGPSKAVLCSYAHIWTFYHDAMPLIVGRDKRVLDHLPIFHSGGLGLLYGQLSNAGSIVITERFRTDRFWEIVRAHRATTTSLLGAMVPFLMGQPASAEDRSHPLRAVTAAPYNSEVKAFGERFGVDIVAAYSMTELANPVQSETNPRKIGVAGKIRAGQHIRLVDDNDMDVPAGEVGEAVVRCDLPWVMFTEYYKNPEATAAAWRNGWFHTGDLLRRDADGDFFFVDRKKDALRRRGENISAYEVEREIRTFPGIKDAAVVAARSDKSEDEVLACIMAVPGETVDLAALVEYLVPRMPYYMVPRYFRVMEDLPRTPTEKVQKYVLREQGVTADTWDREQAGIFLRRERIGAT